MANSTVPNVYSPVFEKQVVEPNRPDGYWIETLPSPNGLDLIGYGLNTEIVKYYLNPYDPSSTEQWPQVEIQKLPSPVGMDKADLRGIGFNDIIICTDYGKTMVNIDPSGGNIIWLENPGHKFLAEAAAYNDPTIPSEQRIAPAYWKSHFIGRSTAMHRLRVGHFNRTDKLQVLGLPIVRQAFDLESPVPVTLWTKPDDILNAEQWDSELVIDHFFHIIHDAWILNFDPEGNTKYQTVIIASQEGLVWLYYSESDNKFHTLVLAEGELGQTSQTGFSGTGGVSVGKLQGNKPYIATCEPFHGNTVTIYTPVGDINNQWKRHVIDVYGPPDTHGEGPIHYVVCADVDNDGDDEFLIAVRGPFPYQGVFCYKARDIYRGLWDKWQVAQDSAARIAIGDFDNDGYLDFATIAYNVPGYFLAPDPAVNVYFNRFAQFSNRAALTKVIIETPEGKPVSVRIPRPSSSLCYLTARLVNIGGVEVDLEVIPPYSSRVVNQLVRGIKVLAGAIYWQDSTAKNHVRKPLIQPKKVETSGIETSDGRIQTHAEGAVIFTFTTANLDPIRYSNIADISISNHVKPTEGWRKVDTLTWGKDNPLFKGAEFYNLQGVKISFLDDGQHLAYVQYWAAGINVNCAVHNHETDHFAEVHACLINGTGGGMEYDADPNVTLSDYKNDPALETNMIKLPVSTFHEHGPLWVIAKDEKPVSRQDGTVIYPVHKWQSLGGPDGNPAYDTWAAFELLPVLADAPKAPRAGRT